MSHQPALALSALLVAFSTILCVAGGAPTFDLPDSLSALRSGTPGEPTTLHIPPGTYTVPTAGFQLHHLSQIVIEGQGVTLLASNFNTPALSLVQCHAVTVRGITVDYDPLPFTQGTVTAIDAINHTVDFAVHAGYPDLSDAYLVPRLNLFDQATGHWKPGTPDYYPKQIERIDLRHGRADFGDKANGFSKIALGDRVAVNIRAAAAISVGEGCAGLRFEDVTIHASPGLGFEIRFAEDAGYYHVRIEPGPPPVGATEPRLLSSCADGFNAAYTRHGPTLDHCDFSHEGDDSVNLHGIMLPVLQWIDDRTFLSMRPQLKEPFDKLLRAGDKVRFIQAPDYHILMESTLASFDRCEQPLDVWKETATKIWPTFRPILAATFFRVRLTAPVSLPVGAFCEFPASTASGYTIQDCYFHDHRARGLRLMASNGVVENNRFERLKGVAISVGPEFEFWREAGWCRNVTIKGNKISAVGEGTANLATDSYTLGAISINARIDLTGGPIPYFSGNEAIRIARNTITDCPIDGISVSAAKGVEIKNNTITNVDLVSAPEAGKAYGLKAGNPISIFGADVTVNGHPGTL